MLAALAAALLLVGPPPAPTRWMTDETGQLSQLTVSSLDAELEALQQATGHQVVVYVARTTGQEPIEDWAARTFQAWKIGRRKLDDGVALFVMLDDRAARIEVGYGLEDQLTDAQASRILRDVLRPHMAAGEVDAAVTDTVHAIAKTIGGGGTETTVPGLPVSISAAKWGAIAIAVVLFIALAIWNPRLAWFLLLMFTGRRRDSRWGGGGRGGFSGGGGRSGGGGASTHW